jgi:hypothetical protein
MGYIPYKLDLNLISSIGNISLYGMSLEIDMPIGSVDMDISREGLQYNDFTKNAITIKLKQVFEEIKQLLLDDINKCTTLFEARIKYKQYYNFANTLNIKLLYKNSELSSVFSSLTTVDFKLKYKITSFIQTYNKIKTRSCESIQCDEKVGFVLFDKSSGPHIRCKELIKNNKYNVVYLIETDKPDDFIKELGITKEQLLLLKDINKPKVVRTTRSERTSGRSWNNGNVIFDKSINMDDGGYYIETEQGKADYNIQWVSEVLYGQLIFAEPIIGVSKRSIGKFRRHPKWTNFTDYIKPIIEKRIQDDKLDELYIESIDYYNIDRSFYSKFDKTNFVKTSYFYKFINSLNKCNKQDSIKLNTFKNLSEIFKLSNKFTILHTKVDIVKELYTHYPLLEELESVYKPSTAFMKDLVTYIQTKE